MSFHVNPHRMLLRLSESYRRNWKKEDFPVSKRELELESALKGIIDDYIAGISVILEEEEAVLQDDFADSVITSDNFIDATLDSSFMDSTQLATPSTSDQSGAHPSSQLAESPPSDQNSSSSSSDLATSSSSELASSSSSEQPASSSSSDAASSTSLYQPCQEDKKSERDYPSWEKVLEAVSFWRDTKPHRIKKQKAHLEIGTVQKNFAFVKDDRQLYRWEKMIDAGESPREYKLAQLASAVREEFQLARSNQQAVHDRDIMRWSFTHAKSLKIPGFRCSKHWLWQFKKTSRISNRKVTKFISRAMLERSVEVVSQAEEFVLQIQEIIAEYGADNTYNMDQSGFERSMMSRSTLAQTGSASVKVVAQSTSGLTHTYTLQPTISATGKLVTPVPICMQETNGEFGPIVKSTMFKCPELIYPIASKSGKMGKEQLKDWFINVMLPAGGNRFVLIVDSYSAHKSLIELIPKGSDIQILPIPPGATGLIQPLDVHGFRYWKDFARHLNKEAMANSDNVQMYTRDSIMKMQALIIRLLSSPKARDFWRKSWAKCGYILEDITEHPSPMQAFVGNLHYCSKCSNIACIFCP